MARAPEHKRTSAQVASVAPLVMTSSTRRNRHSGRDGDVASYAPRIAVRRSRSLRAACGRGSDRRSVGTSGRPSSRATARPIVSAGSKPRSSTSHCRARHPRDGIPIGPAIEEPLAEPPAQGGEQPGARCVLPCAHERAEGPLVGTERPPRTQGIGQRERSHAERDRLRTSRAGPEVSPRVADAAGAAGLGRERVEELPQHRGCLWSVRARCSADHTIATRPDA